MRFSAAPVPFLKTRTRRIALTYIVIQICGIISLHRCTVDGEESHSLITSVLRFGCLLLPSGSEHYETSQLASRFPQIQSSAHPGVLLHYDVWLHFFRLNNNLSVLQPLETLRTSSQVHDGLPQMTMTVECKWRCIDWTHSVNSF